MIGKLLCWLNFHRMLHVGGFHIGGGEIREIAYIECSRCKAKLDWLGNKI